MSHVAGTVGDDEEDRLVPAELGAVWVGLLRGQTVDASLIRKWASRGKIKQHGVEGRAKLYSLAELRAVADRPRVGGP